MSDMTEEDFKEIELSKPDIPKPNLKESIDAKAIIKEKLKHAEELQLKYGKYESMEVSIGISDYWNIIVDKLDIIVKIVKFAPWIIDFMSKVIDIIQLFKGATMGMVKDKRWWISTIIGFILGLGGFLFEYWMNGGAFTWAMIPTVIIPWIYGWFSKMAPKKEVK